MRNRFINLILGLIVAASPIVVSAASIGQSEMDVRRLHGKASSTIAVGSKKILVYPAGKVTLLDGKVVEISGDLDQKTPVRTESAASSAKSVKEKTTLSTKTSTPKHLAKFNNHLVDARGKPIKDPGLAEKDYVLVYYSASWCPPCRKFTPGLVNFYKKKKQGNNFELIFVSSDRSAKDTSKYMQNYNMPWPAVRYDHIASSGLQGKGGRGIPSLILFDKKGKIVSSSYRGNQYLGPNKVLNDLAKRI